jgi:hypothetical protein
MVNCRLGFIWNKMALREEAIYVTDACLKTLISPHVQNNVGWDPPEPCTAKICFQQAPPPHLVNITWPWTHVWPLSSNRTQPCRGRPFDAWNSILSWQQWLHNSVNTREEERNMSLRKGSGVDHRQAKWHVETSPSLEVGRKYDCYK